LDVLPDEFAEERTGHLMPGAWGNNRKPCDCERCGNCTRSLNRQAAVIRRPTLSAGKASLLEIPSLREVRPSREIIRFAHPLASTELVRYSALLRSYSGAVAGFCLLFVWFSRLVFGVKRHAKCERLAVRLLKGQNEFFTRIRDEP